MNKMLIQALPELERKGLECKQAARALEKLLDEAHTLFAAVAYACEPYMPPFVAGQTVLAKVSKALLTVEAVDMAFGDWVVLARFIDRKGLDRAKSYIYPASELEAE